MLVEGVRQMGTAVTHLYYNAPLGSSFVLNEMVIRYAMFAELHLATLIRMRIHGVVERNQRVSSLQCASSWLQKGQQIGTMDAKWSVYNERAMARIRSAARRKTLLSTTVPTASETR